MSDDFKFDPNHGLSAHDKIKHDQALYRDAKIKRHESHGEPQAKANRALEDIARYIQTETAVAPQLKEAEYLGSCAIHVYMLHGLKTAMFVSQVDPMTKRVHEMTASDALTDLRAQLMIGYGRDPQAKRSGF